MKKETIHMLKRKGWKEEDINKAEEIIIFKGVKVVKSDVKPLFP